MGPDVGHTVSVRLCLRIAVLRRLLVHLGWPVRDLPPTLPDEFTILLERQNLLVMSLHETNAILKNLMCSFLGSCKLGLPLLMKP